MFCEKCGKELEGNAKICASCANMSEDSVEKSRTSKVNYKLMLLVAAIVGIIGNCMPWYSLMGSTFTGVSEEGMDGYIFIPLFILIIILLGIGKVKQNSRKIYRAIQVIAIFIALGAYIDWNAGAEVISYGGSRGVGLYVIFLSVIVIVRSVSMILKSIPKKIKHPN